MAPDSAASRPITLTLPDGATRRFDGPVTGFAVAGAIAKSLAKAALAIKVDGAMRDLSREIDHDARIEIVTPDTADGGLPGPLSTRFGRPRSTRRDR